MLFRNLKYSKGPVTGYGKLTWEFAHAWNLMKLCALIVLVMTAIKMVYTLVNSIPLAKYDFVSIKLVTQQSFLCTCNPIFHLLILKEVEFECKIFCVPVFVKTPF